MNKFDELFNTLMEEVTTFLEKDNKLPHSDSESRRRWRR